MSLTTTSGVAACGTRLLSVPSQPFFRLILVVFLLVSLLLASFFSPTSSGDYVCLLELRYSHFSRIFFARTLILDAFCRSNVAARSREISIFFHFWILHPSFFTVLFSIPVSHAFVVSFNALNPLPAPIVTQDNLHPEDKYCQQSYSTVLMYCPHSLYVVVVCPLLPSHFTWNGCQPRVSMMSRTRIRK